MGGPAMTKKPVLSWRERMSELLRLFGEDKITLEEFWSQMRAHGLSDKDIDAYCRGEQR